MMEPEKASHTLDASKQTSLQMAPGCCSASTATACELTGATAERLPETVSATLRAGVHDFSDIALTAIHHHLKGTQAKFYAGGPDAWLETTTLPIYLQHLTLLC
jgi:hypothetical protein